ncbi:hypothetical protein CROQUDRAFT_664029 [Cronartium quercuum f. sp. fusiforme G11]|uniref:Uncharacterized protein n=1 Tax=Cronartium quercuum f. sp. fusiforme G11 TaxID=708437 RepID=A0A9P6NBS1_9BASI|nr:hypothetical protein CROQUDRAFT_664029 [Cronartium quercuum f. sp. fusiforme G11]
MVTSIRAASTYFSKYFDSISTSATQVSSPEVPQYASSPCSSRHSATPEPPPPYVDVVTPPCYSVAITGLSLVDKTNRGFKIYERDLVALSEEWTRRRNYEGNNVQGGPSLAPRRISEMQSLFNFIIQHETCQTVPGIIFCNCRSVTWEHLKKEWCEVMHLLGNAVL